MGDSLIQDGLHIDLAKEFKGKLHQHREIRSARTKQMVQQASRQTEGSMADRETMQVVRTTAQLSAPVVSAVKTTTQRTALEVSKLKINILQEEFMHGDPKFSGSQAFESVKMFSTDSRGQQTPLSFNNIEDLYSGEISRTKNITEKYLSQTIYMNKEKAIFELDRNIDSRNIINPEVAQVKEIAKVYDNAGDKVTADIFKNAVKLDATKADIQKGINTAIRLKDSTAENAIRTAMENNAGRNKFVKSINEIVASASPNLYAKLDILNNITFKEGKFTNNSFLAVMTDSERRKYYSALRILRETKKAEKLARKTADFGSKTFKSSVLSYGRVFMKPLQKSDAFAAYNRYGQPLFRTVKTGTKVAYKTTSSITVNTVKLVQIRNQMRLNGQGFLAARNYLLNNNLFINVRSHHLISDLNKNIIKGITNNSTTVVGKGINKVASKALKDKVSMKGALKSLIKDKMKAPFKPIVKPIKKAIRKGVKTVVKAVGKLLRKALDAIIKLVSKLMNMLMQALGAILAPIAPYILIIIACLIPILIIPAAIVGNNDSTSFSGTVNGNWVQSVSQIASIFCTANENPPYGQVYWQPRPTTLEVNGQQYTVGHSDCSGYVSLCLQITGAVPGADYNTTSLMSEDYIEGFQKIPFYLPKEQLVQGDIVVSKSHTMIFDRVENGKGYFWSAGKSEHILQMKDGSSVNHNGYGPSYTVIWRKL